MSNHPDHPQACPAWLTAWRKDIDAATAALLAGFEDRFGYPPGSNAIDAPGPHDLAAAARLAEIPTVNALLPQFYRHIGQVVLEDIGNAYFIHPASHVLRDLTQSAPIPFDQSSVGALFATDGGGIHFAIATDGIIYRSAAASRDSEFHRVAHDLPDFLDQLRRAVIRFIETGQPGDL